MAEAGDERLHQAHQRRDDEIARRLEAADAGRVAAGPADVAPPALLLNLLVCQWVLMQMGLSLMGPVAS